MGNEVAIATSTAALSAVLLYSTWYGFPEITDKPAFRQGK
jgi:hypothetical protein